MAYGCTITVDTGKIPSSQSNFVWLATEDNFPSAAIDGGSTSILNGGGNLRCYTDDTKATQLPIEVVAFVTGGTPSVQVWGLSPTLAVASTVYIEADSVATTQPAVTDTYGRNAVWVDYEAVIHASETGTNGVFVDSTGNGHDTTLTTGSTLATTTVDHPLGGSWPEFTGLEALTLTTSYQLINNTAFTMSCWCSVDSVQSANGLFGSRDTDVNWAQIQASGRCFSRAGNSSSENLANGALSGGTTSLIKIKQDSSTLDCVINGSVDATDTSVSQGESINNTEPSHNFRVGTYFDNNSSRRYKGRVSELRVRRIKDLSDTDASEYNNQSDSATFWTTSAWAEQSSGISVTEQTNNSNYTTNSPTITLTGSISITESISNTTYTSINPAIVLTGVISITEQAKNTTYTSLDPIIDLTGLVEITESTANTSYTIQNPTITLTSGAIEITESAAGAQYDSTNPSILLTPEPLGIVSTVCFNGTITEVTFNGVNVDLSYTGKQQDIVFNGNFNDLQFNGTIQTTCNTGSIKTNC